MEDYKKPDLAIIEQIRLLKSGGII